MQSISLWPGGPVAPPLGIGTWAWGDFFWDYGNTYGEPEVKAAFTSALTAGILLFDTAEVYGWGTSERLLGKFCRETQQPVILATKYGPLPWRIGPEAVEEAVTASLGRLGVAAVDLYQVHWPYLFLMSRETLFQALAQEVHKGRIRAVGVSNYSAAEMTQAHKALAAYGVPLAVNQVRYSLLDRAIEHNGILSTARNLGVTVLAYSPLAQGLLTGKYTGTEVLSGARRIDPRFTPQGIQRIQPLLILLQELAQQYQKTPAQVALNWLLAQSGVIPIPGAKNAQQALQNAGALGWALAGADLVRLDQACPR